MKNTMVFATHEIKEKGGLTFSEKIPAETLIGPGAEGKTSPALPGEAALTGPCDVSLEFSVGGERILMEGRVEGRWRLSCSRCLTPHEISFEQAVEETYPLTDDSIDAREEVRQTLILNLPAKPLCRPGCLGLCAACGKDLNQGPCDCQSANA